MKLISIDFPIIKTSTMSSKDFIQSRHNKVEFHKLHHRYFKPRFINLFESEWRHDGEIFMNVEKTQTSILYLNLLKIMRNSDYGLSSTLMNKNTFLSYVKAILFYLCTCIWQLKRDKRTIATYQKPFICPILILIFRIGNIV